MHGIDRISQRTCERPACGGVAPGDQGGYPSISTIAQSIYSVWGQPKLKSLLPTRLYIPIMSIKK